MATLERNKDVEDSVTLTRAELRGMLACAWDDGYGSGFDDCEDNPLVCDCAQNPYR